MASKPCPVKDGGGICGETETLAIIQEFKKLYESKMNKIDSIAGGDNLPVLQAKISLQSQWITDLTAQNELLVRAVEELEKVASTRVAELEKTLSAREASEAQLDLEKQSILEEKEKETAELELKLKDKEEEVNTVKRSLLDMRSALTIEVAEKHDCILSLRRDVQQLEEKCRQSNKQTQFRDDIIKELRKEIKSFKEQECEEHETALLLKLKEADDKLKQAYNDIFELKEKNLTAFIESSGSATTLHLDSSISQDVGISKRSDESPTKGSKSDKLENLYVNSKISALTEEGNIPTDARNISEQNVTKPDDESLLPLDSSKENARKLSDTVPSESSKPLRSDSDAEVLKQAMIQSIDNILELEQDTSGSGSTYSLKTANDSNNVVTKGVEEKSLIYNNLAGASADVAPKAAVDPSELDKIISKVDKGIVPEASRGRSSILTNAKMSVGETATRVDKSVVDSSIRVDHSAVDTVHVNESVTKSTRIIAPDVDTTVRRSSSVDNISFNIVSKDDILSKYNSVNDIADVVEYIVDRTLSFAEKNKINFQIKAQSESSAISESEFLRNGPPIASTPKRDARTGSSQRDVDDSKLEDLRNLSKLAEHDCKLFYKMGKELDVLLRNVHEKDIQLKNQQDMIKYLLQRLVVFHQKYHQMQQLQSRRKSTTLKKDCDYIRKTIKALEAENAALKKEAEQCKEQLAKEKAALQQELNESKNKLEQLNENANNLEAERDNYRRQSDAAAKELNESKNQVEKLKEDADNIAAERDNYRRQSDAVAKQLDIVSDMNAKAEQERQKQLSAHQAETANLKKQTNEKEKELDNTRRASIVLADNLDKTKQTESNLKSDLEDERRERKKQSDQIQSLSDENQRQHDQIQDLLAKIAALEKTVFCHCVEESDDEVTDTQNTGVNTDQSGAPTETWQTTTDSTAGNDTEVEEIHTLTVIKTTEHTLTSNDDATRISELEAQLARAMEEREIEREKHSREICNMKHTIQELEKMMSNVPMEADNAPVDASVQSYKNSVEVFDDSEKQYKVEIFQQRQTILNLQEALVATKQQIEELQQKLNHEVSLGWTIRWFGSSSTDSKLSNDEKSCVHDI